MDAVDAGTAFGIVFAAAVLIAAGSLAAAALERASRRLLLGLSSLLGIAAAAGWAAFALAPEQELAVAATGLTVAVVAELGALALRRGLFHARGIDAELEHARKRLEELVAHEVEQRAADLERTLARARADSISLLADEERRVGEERRRAFVEREHSAGEVLSDALAAAERRVEKRLENWSSELARVQETLSSQLKRLEERQRQLLVEAEGRLDAGVERLEGESEEQRESAARVRAEIERTLREAQTIAAAELDTHAAERRRALHELEERMRRREQELRERIQREETDVFKRLEAAFADVERRQVDQLKRVSERAVGRYSEAAALQFDATAKAAREQAAVRLSRELDRSVESLARDSQAMFAERLAHVADAGARRIERRLSQITAGLERQREEFLTALERRLAEAEQELRARIQTIAAEGESERAVLEARLNELARRIDERLVEARDRLGAGSRLQ
jgi:hypothetical protein